MTCRSDPNTVYRTKIQQEDNKQWLLKEPKALAPRAPSAAAARRSAASGVDRIDTIDYKDVPRLRKYVSERAKIIPRRVTGTCAYHQRALTIAIKRARHVALMPYVSD